MSGSLNKVLLIGNLGKDPEMKMTPGGQPMCRFSVATTETWKDRDGNKQSKTEWHNVVTWGKQAEIATPGGAAGRNDDLPSRVGEALHQRAADEPRSADDHDPTTGYLSVHGSSSSRLSTLPAGCTMPRRALRDWGRSSNKAA